jgi:hypothetical protein
MATKKHTKKSMIARLPEEIIKKLSSGTGMGAHRTRRNEPRRREKHKKDLRFVW